MEQKLDMNEKNQEPGEEQLSILIKQAGDEARARKREILARHFNKLRATIAKAVSRQQDSIPL